MFITVVDSREPLWYNTIMDKHDIHHFLKGLTESELVAILESARIALADAKIADEIGQRISMSDPDINHLQNKVYEVLNSPF